MQARQILTTVLGPVQMHAARRNALFAGVEAVVDAEQLVLTPMGRAMNHGGCDKHCIKRADRRGGNIKLAVERLEVFKALADAVVKGEFCPTVLVDWMKVGKLAVLAACVPTEGRSVTLYSEGHPPQKINSPAVEEEFLDHLREVLPAGCRPTLVSDAGFRVPWLKRVSAMGWNYIGRVRGRPWVKPRGGCWRKLKSVLLDAQVGAHDLGTCQLTRSKGFLTRVVTYAEERFESHRKKPLPRRGRAFRRHVVSGREPWVLATSREDITAREVASIYALRMRIEETFRDQKNSRLGWSLENMHTDDPNRLNNMLLIGALAHWLVVAMGYQAERRGLQRAYQANTERRRRVLSLARLGTRILQTVPNPFPLPCDEPALPLSTFGTLKAA
jgi:hypothetical protein